jgi:hypothetical protein
MEGLKKKRLDNDDIRKELGLPENGYKSTHRKGKIDFEFYKNIE